MTVATRPAMTSVPALAAKTTFLVRLICTWPDPVPLAPDVTLIHASLLDADHEQPGCVVTVIGVPAPPRSETVWPIGEMLYVHGPA